MNTHRIFIAIICIWLFMQTRSFTSIRSIKIKVDGIDCQFCAYNLGKKLTELTGVKSANVNQDRGTALVTLNDAKKFNLSSIKKALSNSQFKLKNMRICARGKIIKLGSHFFFHIPNYPRRIYLMQEENEEPQKVASSFTQKWGNKIRSLWKNTVDKLSPTKKLKTNIQNIYNKKASAEIICDIHTHGDGNFGLANYNARLSKIKRS